MREAIEETGPALALAALRGGAFDRAEALYAALAAAQPDEARWRIGLARVALGTGRAAAALALLDTADRLAAIPNPAWGALRGQALLDAVQVPAAEAQFRASLGLAPWLMAARLGLAQLLRRVGRSAEALALLEAAPQPATATERSACDAVRIAALIDLARLGACRGALDTALARAESAGALHALFSMIAPVHGLGSAAEAAFRTVRERLGQVPPTAADRPGERDLLGARLAFALGEADTFQACAAPLVAAGQAGPLLSALRAALSPVGRRVPVFVIGLSKTGTSSLDEALRLLGFRAQHWSNPITQQMLAMEDANIFDAMSDIPVADMFEALAARHPDARFVLTERAPGPWIASVTSHYRRSHGTADFAALCRLIEDPDTCPHGQRWRDIHRRLYTRHAGYGAALAAHAERVAAFFAPMPGRLLRFDAASGDGWPKLCDFLGLPQPAEGFPHANRAPGAG